MADYKLSLTAEEIEKKLTSFPFPVVTIEKVDNITDEESVAIDEAISTGLPVMLKLGGSNSYNVGLAEIYVSNSGFAEMWLSSGDCFIKEGNQSKWRTVGNE